MPDLMYEGAREKNDEFDGESSLEERNKAYEDSCSVSYIVTRGGLFIE